jgi:phosphohistidine phosphatase SixA
MPLPSGLGWSRRASYRMRWSFLLQRGRGRHGSSPVSIDDRIYDNRPDNLLAIAREADEPVQTLAIVGHNPSIEWFMARHGGAGDVPTGTVVVFDVTGSWADGEIGFVRAETCRAD